MLCTTLFLTKICAINNVYSRLSYSLLTALPILAVASAALSTCVGLVLSANDLVICDTNSTEMPTACKQHTECEKGSTYMKRYKMHKVKEDEVQKRNK